MHQVVSKEKKRFVKVPSEAMIAQRERFASIAKMVMQMRASGSKKSRKQLWKIATEAYDSAH